MNFILQLLLKIPIIALIHNKFIVTNNQTTNLQILKTYIDENYSNSNKLLNLDVVLSNEYTLDTFIFINDYTTPLPVGYGANSLNVTYLILANTNNKDIKFYLPYENGKLLDRPAHDTAQFLYGNKPVTITLTLKDIEKLQLSATTLAILYPNALQQIEKEIALLNSKYYKHNSLPILHNYQRTIKASIALITKSHPELFI